MLRCILAIVAIGGPFSADSLAGDDILIANFEKETYGEWNAEGEAFGPGPASGTLSGQMSVTGFQGDRLVNSFFQGDGTKGKLTSPPIQIARDYLTFLIGGGGHEGKTCINLLLDGEVVRTAVGPNTEPGGSEELAAHFWDVKEYRGKTVTLEIVDDTTGGWGHINIDQIVLSDVKPSIPKRNAVLRTSLSSRGGTCFFQSEWATIMSRRPGGGRENRTSIRCRDRAN